MFQRREQEEERQENEGKEEQKKCAENKAMGKEDPVWMKFMDEFLLAFRKIQHAVADEFYSQDSCLKNWLTNWLAEEVTARL